MTLTDQRRSYLRGSYLDRIIECAQHYAATHSYFIDAEFLAFIGAEFDWLIELSAEEQQYLRDQVGLESLRRVALSRAKDREEVFGKFVAENPDVVSADADFAFDLGWLDLAKDAGIRIRTYPKSWKVRLDGGKEKFGCLVLFLPCDYGQRGCRSEVERLLEEVRLRSLATCDICGAGGRLRLGNWAKTVCSKHAAVLGEMRDDDGAHADPWKWNADDEVEAATSALTEKIAADIKQLSGREGRLLSRFLLEIEEAVRGCAVGDADIDDYVRDEIEKWIRQDLDPTPFTDDDKAWLHGYVRASIREERERIRDD